MAKEPKNKPESGDESVLVGAAKAIGGLAGKVASKVGAGDAHASEGQKPQTPAPSASKGKLQPKHKSRLPRRQKKEMKKKMAAQQAG